MQRIAVEFELQIGHGKPECSGNQACNTVCNSLGIRFCATRKFVLQYDNM